MWVLVFIYFHYFMGRKLVVGFFYFGEEHRFFI